jgi:1-acyl-sn-glycerol-3-phosphate acyltransferase
MMAPMIQDAHDVRRARREVRRQRRIDRRLRLIVRLMHLLTVPFVRYRISGGARIDASPNIIIAGNHRSLLDVVIGLYTAHLFGLYPRTLIAQRYVKGRWTGPIARWIGAIPVAPGRDGAHALDQAIMALRNGAPTVVMPEGRLHQDSEDRLSMGTARTGVSRLAVGAAVPVVAAGVLGADRAWPPDRFLNLNPFRRRTVAVQVADDPLCLHGDDHRANADLVMDAIGAELARAAAEHPELL